MAHLQTSGLYGLNNTLTICHLASQSQDQDTSLVLSRLITTSDATPMSFSQPPCQDLGNKQPRNHYSDCAINGGISLRGPIYWITDHREPLSIITTSSCCSCCYRNPFLVVSPLQSLWWEIIAKEYGPSSSIIGDYRIKPPLFAPTMGDLAKILLLVGLASFAQALSPVEVQGQELVDSGTGKRFEIIGVDYQPGGEAGYSPASGVDPLSDGDICLRDAALMQRLGTNTIRAYNVNPYINHDACASVFNAVGIYMIIDVNSPLKNESLDRNFPTTSYTASYINRTFAVIEAFRNYPNLIGFFSGNEIVNDPGTESVALS